MNHLETILSWLTVAFELGLCSLVFVNRAQRILPIFAAYSSTLLAGTIGVWLVYKTFGFHSLAAYYSCWITLLFNAGMRSLAIAELCRYKLRMYRGIWGLVWRLLVGMSMLFLLHAAVDTLGQPNRLAIYSLTLDRDLDIASVAILAALLLIHKYYGFSLEPLQRRIAAGFCLVCAVDVIGDTLLRSLFTGYLFSCAHGQRPATLVHLTASIRAGRRRMEHSSSLLFHGCDGNLVLRASKASSRACEGSGATSCRGLSGIVAGDQFASERI